MIISIKVFPNSEKQKIEKISDKNYKAYLKKPPKNRKANFELLKLLKKEFKKPVRIIKGLKNKNKIIEIQNAD